MPEIGDKDQIYIDLYIFPHYVFYTKIGVKMLDVSTNVFPHALVVSASLNTEASTCR